VKCAESTDARMRFYSIITRSLTCNALIIRHLLFYETSHNPWVRTVTVKLILATSTGAMFLLRRTFPRPALNGLIGRNNPKVFPSRSVGSSEPDLAVLRSANSFRASHRRARAARSDTSSSTTSRVNRRPYARHSYATPLLSKHSQPRSTLLTGYPKVIGLRPGQMLKTHARQGVIAPRTFDSIPGESGIRIVAPV
jgi:hypothetical protein